MELNRRDFLKVGVTGAGAAAFMPAILRRGLGSLRAETVHAAPVDNGRILVVVQMSGGNDGLNTVIPIADQAYYDNRVGISIAASDALQLNPTTGLNPNLSKLKGLWDTGNLAIVEGVGYPNQNYSHFVSTDIWQYADPTLKQREGWVGRYFDTLASAQTAPFLGLAVGSTQPESYYSPFVSTPAVQSVAQYTFQSDPSAPTLTAARNKLMTDLYGSAPGAYGPLFNATLKTATASVQTLQSAHQAYKAAVTYPSTGFAQALLVVAETIAVNAGVKVYHVTIGGFDTHANEPTDQSRQLLQMSEALGAFYADLKAHGLDSNVLIMTWSEFGRRVKANASTGTDHGSAAPLFFIGTPVKGGLYGGRPSLTNLDNGNLKFTTDFRQPYATALTWIGASPAELVGPTYPALPLLKA